MAWLDPPGTTELTAATVLAMDLDTVEATALATEREDMEDTTTSLALEPKAALLFLLGLPCVATNPTVELASATVTAEPREIAALTTPNTAAC